MAQIIDQEHLDRKTIGRQISLPLTKAFEIAWKGIKIRLWRSLITMSGIILAIAFLMSVWTSDVFTKAMRSVESTDSRYSLVQGVLEAQAIASGAVNLKVHIVEPSGMAGPMAGVTAGTAMRTQLEGNRAASATLLSASAEAIADPIAPARRAKWPDALVIVGFPETLNDEAVGKALADYVKDGGFVLFYGSRGLDKLDADSPVRAMMPAQPTDSKTIQVTEAPITTDPAISISGMEGRVHPAASFVAAEAAEGALAAVKAGDHPLVWWCTPQGATGGAVAWYPIADDQGTEPDLLSWFVTGRIAGVTGDKGTASLLTRVVTRGAGTTIGEESHDTRGIWLVTLSLMVCVVGITNAMLMSVTERFREIGTMKCLGALDAFIVKLFLIESSLQGVVGSILGAFIGFGLAFTRALFTFRAQDLTTGKMHWLSLEIFPMLDLLMWMGIAVLVGVVLAVVAAIYPATRAAKMAPVDAMRSEA